MEILFTSHSAERMEEYSISEGKVREALNNSDKTVKRHSGRKIAHLAINGKILRVIFEEEKNVKTGLKAYPAGAERYGV